MGASQLQDVAELITFYDKFSFNFSHANDVVIGYPFIICALYPRPSGRGYKARSVKVGFVAVEYIV
jgi:hypothetical protein